MVNIVGKMPKEKVDLLSSPKIISRKAEDEFLSRTAIFLHL